MVSLTIIKSIDIWSAGKNNAVQTFDLPFDDIKIRHAGDDDGHAASRRNSPKIDAIISAKP